MSPHTGIEVSLDRRDRKPNEAETLRVRQYPLQASLLLFPARGAFAPYLLGGAGWYSNRIEATGRRRDGFVGDRSRLRMARRVRRGAQIRPSLPRCTATIATRS